MSPDERERRLALARPAYRDVEIYAPQSGGAAPTVVVDVSDNTNLWGPPPMALRALRELSADVVSRYPSLYAHELKAPLARYVGAAADEIVTGCGSDDVLDSAMRAVCEPGDRVAFSVPTFSMVPTFARMNGLEPVAVPLRGAAHDWDADADALLATGARVIYLCSPNNPTGTLVRRGTVERVIAGAPGLVVLDEAYGEFAEFTFARRSPAFGNVLVTRTLSKAFGLAGLRIGYGVGAAGLVREVEKARGPYMVNAAAQRAAVVALEDDFPWVQARAQQAVELREWLAGEIRALGLEVLPSSANFVLVLVPDAAGIMRRLRRRGVLVRAFPGLPLVGDALRIGVGPWETMSVVLDALRAELGPPAAGEASS
jgi:histidinol-phosphate aminotransferase